MTLESIRQNLLNRNAIETLVIGGALLSALCGAVNLLAWIVFQTYLPTVLALSCGAGAMLCVVLVGAVCSKSEDEDGFNEAVEEYLLLAGSVGSFATAYFAGAGPFLSLYAVGMFAISHRALFALCNQ